MPNAAQIIYCDDSTAKMSGQRVWRAKDQSAPYIPQPDYTPLPARRSGGLVPTGVQLSAGDLAYKEAGKSMPGTAAAAAAATLPRLDDKSKLAAYYNNRAFDATVPESFAERAWNSSQWSSSQFSVSDWSVALMQKQLCLEAKTRREERIRSAADKALESFEKEMDLYLDEEDEEQPDGREAAMKAVANVDSGVSSGITPSQSSSSLSSSVTPTTTGSLPRPVVERLPSTNGAPSSSPPPLPVAPDSSPSSSTTSGSGGRSRPLRNSRDRDQISLESGYMSSYPGDAQQRHHHHNGGTC